MAGRCPVNLADDLMSHLVFEDTDHHLPRVLDYETVSNPDGSTLRLPTTPDAFQINYFDQRPFQLYPMMKQDLLELRMQLRRPH